MRVTVAYSFKAHFEAPIRAGTKAQTIRADRARHARAGEELQLYTGMRTKHCRLIGRATCMSVSPVQLDFGREVIIAGARPMIHDFVKLDEFARMDGFPDFLAMREFWRKEHGMLLSLRPWSGILIEWKDFRPAP